MITTSHYEVFSYTVPSAGSYDVDIYIANNISFYQLLQQFKWANKQFQVTILKDSDILLHYRCYNYFDNKYTLQEMEMYCLGVPVLQVFYKKKHTRNSFVYYCQILN